MLKRKIDLSRAQLIALGFLTVIITGTFLLMLPFSTKNGQSTDFLGALFTATSASCITGLVAYDTFTHWTVFGQLVILTMIQIGGLGFVTIGVYGMSVFHKKIGLKSRELIHDSLNSNRVGGGVALVKHVVCGSLIFELAGAFLLSTRFIPEMGVLKGIYFSVFHSVSAFCNAGFDIMGGYGEFSSLTAFAGDYVVICVISFLIIIGGIGFIVWEDIYKNKYHFKRYMLHTKIVICVTAILIVGGTFFFLYSERNGVLSGFDTGKKILSSFFMSVSPRTAGFNSVELSELSAAGKAMHFVLMFIGGSPCSTAGGVKTTSVATVAVFLVSYIKREKGCNAFKRSLDESTVKKAAMVIFINLSLAVSAVIIILLNQQLDFADVTFEALSAVGTVGMTTGITRDLSELSKTVIMILMFFGRVGSLSFAMSFRDNRKVPDIRYPVENLMIG